MKETVKDALGIVLAGGLATRMPNKPLLIIKGRVPTICSSIDLFIRSKIERIVIVVPSFSPIPDVLSPIYENIENIKIDYVIQPKASGVPHAMTYAVQDRNLKKDHHCYISCCDNVYDDRLVIPEITIPYATVRHCPGWKAIHLAKAADTWIKKANTSLCVAGWFGLTRGLIECAQPEQETTDYLNAINATAHQMDSEMDWWDVGTPDMYAAYWRSK